MITKLHTVEHPTEAAGAGWLHWLGRQMDCLGSLYKLKNRLFGWDYIAWRNFAADGVARVHVSDDGVVWYWRYKNTHVIDRIVRAEQVIWLTCHPEKYLPTDELSHGTERK